MLSDSKAFSGFAVDDLDAARRFYGETLGLTVKDMEEGPGLLSLELPGDRSTLIYPKPDHTPADYTILNFPVADVEATVDWLAARGVEFERYDGMGQDDKGIAHEAGPLIAWFKDPAGNVLSVLEA
jgi:catechol 2,3-dioxygenase-like lactoylglutathione lyase family enzyme